MKFSRGHCMGSDTQLLISNHCLSLIFICMEACLLPFSSLLNNWLFLTVTLPSQTSAFWDYCTFLHTQNDPEYDTSHLSIFLMFTVASVFVYLLSCYLKQSQQICVLFLLKHPPTAKRQAFKTSLETSNNIHLLYNEF